MGCSNMIAPPFTECKSLNNQLLDCISQLPDNVRKWMRLLAKQFRIMEVYQEEDTFCDIGTKRITTKEGWYVMIYEDEDREFKMRMHPGQFDHVITYKKNKKKKWVVIAHNKFI